MSIYSIYDGQVITVDDGAQEGTDILMNPFIQWVGSFCRGCDADPSPTVEWSPLDGARIVAESGWRYLENGPNGSGNYCPECLALQSSDEESHDGSLR